MDSGYCLALSMYHFLRENARGWEKIDHAAPVAAAPRAAISATIAAVARGATATK